MAARAFWLVEPGRGVIRSEPLTEPGPGEVLVRTVCSGISRGTETLVFRGQVPVSQYERMRAPFQQGEFPGPIKYGYLNVGVVEIGPDELRGHTVFCLYPHQDRYVVPVTAVLPVPAGVPPRRAVLAGAVETAVTAMWDAPPLLGDHVTVIGAGMIGGAVARLLARIPGVRVSLVDVEPSRAQLASKLGVQFATPPDAPVDQDLVIHASGTAAGLQRALELVATEGTVLELSWYGDRSIELNLGADFHSRRLELRSSQVGSVPPARRGRRSRSDRLNLALELLRDPAFDALLTGVSAFRELPSVLASLATGAQPGLCHVIDYER